MIHENIYLNQIEREKSQEKDYQNLRDYGQQFIVDVCPAPVIRVLHC